MSELARRASRERLDAAIARLRYALAAENLRIKARQVLTLCKAYDPNQPRVPAGSSEGGQWTSEGRPVRFASSDRKPFGRAGRIGILFDAGRRLIDAFRKENQLRDFFGDDVGTVAITSLNDKYIFGFNSGTSEFSGQYTDRDEAAAVELRDRMLAKYPAIMATRNIGAKPNDALYHAETTVLLRAARENGGTLAGKNLVVVVDRLICPSCGILLPYVSRELGNPTVTFVDRTGHAKTIRNGDWDD